MNTNKAKRYLAAVQDEKVGITEYGTMTIPGVPGVSMADAEDKAGKYGLEHVDKTPCDAKTPESCPHNKNIEGAEKGITGNETAAPTGIKVSEGNKVGAEADQASDDLHEYEYEAMDEHLQDVIEGFEGKSTSLTFDFGGGIGFSGEASFESPCFEDYCGIGKTEDGEWARITRIVPLGSDDDLAQDIKSFNAKMSEYGLSISEDLWYDKDDDIKRFDERGGMLNPKLYALYGGIRCCLTVSNPEKFQEYKDSFKEGGSRSNPDLVEKVKDDLEWKASPEGREYLQKMKAKFPTVKWD